MHFRNVTQPRFTICVRSLKHLCIPICPCVICFHLTREKDRDKNDASKNFSWKDVYVQTTNLRISSPNQPSKRVRNNAKRVRNSAKMVHNSIKRIHNIKAPKGSGILPVRARNKPVFIGAIPDCIGSVSDPFGAFTDPFGAIPDPFKTKIELGLGRSQ